MPRRIVAACALVVLVLCGCAPAPEPSTPHAPAAVPERPPVNPIEQYADDRLGVMTLREKIASMLMFHVPGTDAATVAAFARQWQLGGIILMGDNVPATESQLADITAHVGTDPGLPVLVAIDQEGGVVRRLWSDTWAAAEQLRFASPDAARAAFAARSELLASLGVTVNFGIVADVTGDTGSFIYDRSLGGSGADAAPRVLAAVHGEHGIVLSTLKHFPGHGAAAGDSHSGIPTTGMELAAWRANEAVPFEAGIGAGAEFVMFGHLQYSAVDPVPASLSPEWHSILRDELGFDGIAITDDMAMLQYSGLPEFADPGQNAVRAVAAGNTMLLYVGGADPLTIITAIEAAVADGRLTEAQIDDATRRLLVLRRELSGETGRFVHCFEECQGMLG